MHILPHFLEPSECNKYVTVTVSFKERVATLYGGHYGGLFPKRTLHYKRKEGENKKHFLVSPKFLLPSSSGFPLKSNKALFTNDHEFSPFLIPFQMTLAHFFLVSSLEFDFNLCLNGKIVVGIA